MAGKPPALLPLSDIHTTRPLDQTTVYRQLLCLYKLPRNPANAAPGPKAATGCASVHEEHTSGADRSRTVLARLLRDIAAGDTLVVVPARSARPLGQSSAHGDS
jgi:hypothetical protein